MPWVARAIVRLNLPDDALRVDQPSGAVALPCRPSQHVVSDRRLPVVRRFGMMVVT